MSNAMEGDNTEDSKNYTEWDGIVIEAVAAMMYVFICSGVVASTSNVTFDELNSPRLVVIALARKFIILERPCQVHLCEGIFFIPALGLSLPWHPGHSSQLSKFLPHFSTLFPSPHPLCLPQLSFCCCTPPPLSCIVSYFTPTDTASQPLPSMLLSFISTPRK